MVLVVQQTVLPTDDELIGDVANPNVTVAKSVIAGNGSLGIHMFGTVENVTVEKTAIVGNVSTPIAIDGTKGTITIKDNIIGTIDGTVRAVDAINLSGSGEQHTITGNIIARVKAQAVRLNTDLTGGGLAASTIDGNYVGVFPTFPAGGGTVINDLTIGRGINISNMGDVPLTISNNTIANTTDGSNGNGISLGTNAHAVTVEGNTIRNVAAHGIKIKSSDHLIKDNVISVTDLDGISIFGSSDTGNQLIGNLIWNTTGQRIDLGNNGATANDTGDGDSGANGLQNYPVFTVTIDGSNSYIRGILNSLSGETFDLEFFSQASTSVSPALWHRVEGMVTDGSGNFEISIDDAGLLAEGTLVSGTATLHIPFGRPSGRR